MEDASDFKLPKNEFETYPHATSFILSKIGMGPIQNPKFKLP
jgi:hypothetical protein